MSEKKELKINLTTLLLIISILVIIIMGMFIFKLTNENAKYEDEISNLNSDTGNINSQSNDASINNFGENKPTDNSTKYQISGEYIKENARGDEPFYTFFSNNTVTFGALWKCTGTYKIENDTIKISFTSAVDPDGRKVSVKDYGVSDSVELAITTDGKLKDNSNGNIYATKTSNTSDNITKTYKISGTYKKDNATGDEPFYTFSSNNTVTYGSLWKCTGTYKIENDTIKISFTSAVDPDGKKISVKDCDVNESVELSIINESKLKNNSNESTYSK